MPPIVIGLLIPFLIKNSPKDVGYLNVEEKAWLMSNAGRSKSGSKITLGDFLKGIKNKKYLLYALLNFGMVCGIYGFGTWLPSIITALSGGDIFRVSLLALIPTAWPRCWCTRGACGPAKPKSSACSPALAWWSPLSA